MSFSSNLKETLAAFPIKKKCCQHTFHEIMEIDKSLKEDQTEKLRSVYERCRCSGCLPQLIKALFIKFGSMTDPEKQYHLDFTFRYETERDLAAELLTEAELEPKTSTRGSKYIVYFKGSTCIEDLLVYIGASAAAFDLMNQKIVKELRNATNRQVNCDTANIERVLQASQKYLEAIDYLIDTGEINAMPQNLRETALLKRSNPQISLEDLGLMLNPGVSKSGMRHRLEKIYQYYTDKTESEKN